MTDDDLIARARAMATRAHASQKRKYSGEPYIVHPEHVASILAETGLPASVVAAAWLHDVIEDCNVTSDEIASEVSPEVAQLVLEVTDISHPGDGNRQTRRRIDRDHLAKASAEGQSIKLADLISNTPSIVENDPDFARVYLREKDELLQVLTRGDRSLYRRAAALPRARR
jgi:(p)ppGpp synthase/HD superfamily hydrolase